MILNESEFILNPDGSMYHLNLKPGEVAETIFTVGDPNRVPMVSKYFDSLEVEKQHREFVTHTGRYKGKRLSVISTGIGTDNIDIALNELDALFNIDFTNRRIKEQRTSLQIIRLGTSGALQDFIPLEAIVCSDYGVGFDNVLRFYSGLEDIETPEFTKSFLQELPWNPDNAKPYAVQASPHLRNLFTGDPVINGITTTHVGFYGPQGRQLRLPVYDSGMMDALRSFRFQGLPLTNLEMETAAIYGLSKLLGHEALSLNVILANRATGMFSQNPTVAVDRLIRFALERIVL